MNIKFIDEKDIDGYCKELRELELNTDISKASENQKILAYLKQGLEIFKNSPLARVLSSENKEVFTKILSQKIATYEHFRKYAKA